MAVIRDIDEVLKAHQAIRNPGPGAPPITNGERVGVALLRGATMLISAMLQVAVETTFKKAIPLTFDHFTADEIERFWEDCRKSAGNPNPENIKRLFFRIGFSDALDSLSWRNSNNATVRRKLDEINQVRNRIAHGQPITVNGQAFRVTRPVVTSWRNFAEQFCGRFDDHIVDQYDDE
jgi:hypothetical protein